MACTFLSSQNKPKKIFYHYFHVTGWKIIDKLWTTISAYSSSLRNLQKLWSLVSNSCSAFPTLQNSNLCIHLSNPAPKTPFSDKYELFFSFWTLLTVLMLLVCSISWLKFFPICGHSWNSTLLYLSPLFPSVVEQSLDLSPHTKWMLH